MAEVTSETQQNPDKSLEPERIFGINPLLIGRPPNFDMGIGPLDPHPNVSLNSQEIIDLRKLRLMQTDGTDYFDIHNLSKETLLASEIKDKDDYEKSHTQIDKQILAEYEKICSWIKSEEYDKAGKFYLELAKNVYRATVSEIAVLKDAHKRKVFRESPYLYIENSLPAYKLVLISNLKKAKLCAKLSEIPPQKLVLDPQKKSFDNIETDSEESKKVQYRYPQAWKDAISRITDTSPYTNDGSIHYHLLQWLLGGVSKDDLIGSINSNSELASEIEKLSQTLAREKFTGSLLATPIRVNRGMYDIEDVNELVLKPYDSFTTSEVVAKTFATKFYVVLDMPIENIFVLNEGHPAFSFVDPHSDSGYIEFITNKNDSNNAQFVGLYYKDGTPVSQKDITAFKKNNPQLFKNSRTNKKS